MTENAAPLTPYQIAQVFRAFAKLSLNRDLLAMDMDKAFEQAATELERAASLTPALHRCVGKPGYPCEVCGKEVSKLLQPARQNVVKDQASDAKSAVDSAHQPTPAPAAPEGLCPICKGAKLIKGAGGSVFRCHFCDPEPTPPAAAPREEGPASRMQRLGARVAAAVADDLKVQHEYAATPTSPPAFDATAFVHSYWAKTGLNGTTFGLAAAAHAQGRAEGVVLPEEMPDWFAEMLSVYGALKTPIGYTPEGWRKSAWKETRDHLTQQKDGTAS
jgi:hypothetical protein